MKKIIVIQTIVFLLLGFGTLSINALSTTSSVSPTITTSVTTTITPTTKNKLQDAATLCLTKLQTRVTNIKSQANTWITDREKSTSEAENDIDLNSKLMTNSNSSTQAQNNVNRLKTDDTGITNLNTQIQAFKAPSTCDPTTVVSTLLPLVKQIFTNFRIYAEEIPFATADSHVLLLQNLAINAQAMSKSMASDVTFAQVHNATSVQIAKLQADQTVFNNDIATLIADINSVSTIVNGISPSAYPTNVAQIKGLLTNFKTIHTDVVALQPAFKQFITDFNTDFGIGKKTTTTIPTTTSPTTTVTTTH